MTIFLVSHDFKYEIEAICKLFFPAIRFQFAEVECGTDDDYVLTKLESDTTGLLLTAAVQLQGSVTTRTELLSANAAQTAREHCLCRLVFSVLQERTGVTPPWGMMTGIRPVKLLRTYQAQGMDLQEAAAQLRGRFQVSEAKLQLAMETAAVQAPMLTHLSPELVSLYISIPFCPSRCSYCSFVSHSIATAQKLMPDYVRCLCRELSLLAELMQKLHLKLDTIYIGGGTPTAITAAQLEKIMKTVQEFFDICTLREYTVEAGRADTITAEKLAVILRYGATRISINPQTLSDAVLLAIGRQHTAQQAIDAYFLARSIGFTNINMDLIAGLPTDTASQFRDTLDRVIALNPESVTVHTLTLKRSATLFPDGAEQIANPASEMVDYSIRELRAAGYRPYYLYRQKNTLENLENVGYAKLGAESLYNILIMEENQTILGAGCAASTKVVTPDGAIKRIHNHKFPYEYINRFDALMEKKSEIYQLLGGLSNGA